MPKTHILTRRGDIQNWVQQHEGHPAFASIRSLDGGVRQRLKLAFRNRRQRPQVPPAIQDDGVTPCSWAAWHAEMQRQKLALLVSEDGDSEDVVNYELVEMRELGM